MSSPLVSVIMPVYNGEKYVSEAIQSVLAQESGPQEIIVVDDGSTDGSADVCASFSSIRYIRQENQGVAMARNRAIENSTGEYFAFLDQDDRWASNKLTTQVEFLKGHPTVDYVLAQQQVYLDGTSEKPSWLKEELLKGEHTGYHLGTALIRRNVLENVGMFDPQYRIGSDSDWFLRAKDAEMKMAVLPDVLLYKRVHDKNESSRVQQSSRELLAQIRRSLHRRREGGGKP